MRKKEQNENKKYSKKAPKDLQEIIVNKNKIFQKIPHKVNLNFFKRPVSLLFFIFYKK